MNIIYKSPFDHQHKVLKVNKDEIVPLNELKRRILLKEVIFSFFQKEIQLTKIHF